MYKKKILFVCKDNLTFTDLLKIGPTCKKATFSATAAQEGMLTQNERNGD